MLNLVVKPHRKAVFSGFKDYQKIFLMLKFVPEIQQLSTVKNKLLTAIIVDSSGSMHDTTGTNKTKIELVHDAVKEFLSGNYLGEEDEVMLIKFSDYAETIFPLTPYPKAFQQHGSSLQKLFDNPGSTYMAKAMQTAYEILSDHPKEITKTTLILTDGMTYDERDCLDLAYKYANAGITAKLIGTGVEYNEELLLQIADITRGKARHIKDLSEFKQFLEDELQEDKHSGITNLEASFQPVKDVKITSIKRVFPSIYEIDVTNPQDIYLGNALTNDETIFIVDMDLPPRPKEGIYRIAQVEITYSIPSMNIYNKKVTHQVKIEYTTDEQKTHYIDQEVMGYVTQYQATKLITEATRIQNTNPTQATKLLEDAELLTKQIGNIEATRLINQAKQQLQQQGQLSEDVTKMLKVESRTHTKKV